MSTVDTYSPLQAAPSDELNLRPIFGPLKGRSWFMIFTAFVGAAAALAYTFKSAPVWRADGTLLLVISAEDLGGGGGGGGLSSLMASLSPSSPDPLQVIEGLIKSKPTTDLIIDRTHIARRDIEQGLKVERQQKQAEMTIQWEDKDKARALTVVQTAMDGLDLLHKNLTITTADQSKKSLEQAISERSADLDRAEQALAAYQKNMKAPSNPLDPSSVSTYTAKQKEIEVQLLAANALLTQARSKAKASTSSPEIPSSSAAMSRFREQLVGLEFQLHALQTQFGPQSPNVVRLQRQIDAARADLATEARRQLQSVNQGLDPAIATLEANRFALQTQLDEVTRLASAAPNEAIQLNKLAQEVLTLGTVVQQLRISYEKAKVAAEVSRINWNVLEKPYIEDRPTNKRYALYPAIGAFLGFLGGAAILILFYGRKRKYA